MSELVTDSYGRRIVPPRELPPGAIGWNIYECEPWPPGEAPAEPDWTFRGFAAAGPVTSRRALWLSLRRRSCARCRWRVRVTLFSPSMGGQCCIRCTRLLRSPDGAPVI